jgi:hypothetical protein
VASGEVAADRPYESTNSYETCYAWKPAEFRFVTMSVRTDTLNRFGVPKGYARSALDAIQLQVEDVERCLQYLEMVRARVRRGDVSQFL